MKKKYVILAGLLGVFSIIQAMGPGLPKELTDTSVKVYLEKLENDVKNEDLQSIHQHYKELYNL